jgi:type I restriction-modification system DNA methylase subunit
MQNWKNRTKKGKPTQFKISIYYNIGNNIGILGELMVNYDYQFLNSKGFFENQRKYNEDGKCIIIDIDNYLAYVEVNDNNEVDELKELISNKYSKIEIIYFHYQTDNKIKVYRKFGEVKGFYYADTISNPDRKKSKQYKLKKFSPDNVDILFDIKEVMDRFYKDLWTHRLKMSKSITELLTDNNKLFIAQHFIDRLVFFYFLAQLGIIEVNIDRNGEIYNYKLNKTGTKDFFKLLSDNFKDAELHSILNKIFFEGLGNGKSADEDGVVSLSIPMNDINITIKAPYLNGGLYRVKEFNGIKETEIKFEGIKDLIETLNQYNWVIGEYVEEEDDSVGSLTPEVMGHVYEKFVVGLENIGEIKLDEIEIGKEVKIGRKKVGAFYTPEEITKYISENTIISYLFDKLEVGEQFKDFDNFVDKASTDLLKKALGILNDIKMLDPACGSGHFLVCAGELLFNMKNSICEKLEEIDDSFGRKYNAYNEVKTIIVDNLYGVDICDSAVEITKLRLWLWLVSQLKDSSSKLGHLPNLEYNIRCGNSLIGWVDEELTKISLNNSYTDEVKGILRGLVPSFKGKDREDIDNARDFFNSYDLNKYIDGYYLLYKLYRKSYGDEANDLKKIIETIRDSIYNGVTPAFLDYVNRKIKPNYNRNKPPITKEEFAKLQVFHWRVDFGWIIKDGGFDVVIGNPPYGNILKGNEKQVIKRIYKTTQTDKVGKGSMNVASIFIEQSYNILKKNGSFGMIVPHRITRTNEFSKLINFLLTDTNLYHLVDSGNPFKPYVNLEMVEIFYKKSDKQGACITKSRRCDFVGYLDKELCKKISILMIYFNNELKEFLDLMGKDALFNIIDATQGKPRRRDYVEYGDITCVGAKDIDSYIINLVSGRIVDKNYITKNKLEWQLDNELLVCPNFSNKFEVAIKKRGFLPDGTSVIIKPKIEINNYYLMAVLNSDIINFYLWNFILNRGELTNNICSFITNKIPIKIKNEEKIVKMAKDVELGILPKSKIDDEIKQIYLEGKYEAIQNIRY